MKYSIILLEYDPENKLTEMRAECLRLIKKHSHGDYEIIKVNIKGLSKALNHGFSQATGEYFFMVASDIMIHDDRWLQNLSMPNTVTSWRERTMYVTGEKELEMSFFCVPRNVWETVGRWDEIFDEGYGFDDDDWLRRVRKAGFSTEIIPVNAQHLESKTFKSLYDDEKFKAMRKRNEDIFCEQYKDEVKVAYYKQTHA